MKIIEYVEQARYSDDLEVVINELKPLHLKWLEYEADYQGYVNIDVLLEDGRVFSYEYSYGSCSGCDEWEHRSLRDYELRKEMIKGSVIYSDMETYMKGIGAKRKEKAFEYMNPNFFEMSEFDKLEAIPYLSVKEVIWISWTDTEFYDKYRILFNYENR